MSVYKQLPAADGQYVMELGSQLGQIDLRITSADVPANGVMVITAIAWDGAHVTWTRQPLDLSELRYGPLTLGGFGHFRALVVQLAGIPAGLSPFELWASTTACAGPTEAWVGKRALTVQSFTEANVKRGFQFYVQTNAVIAAGTSWLLGLTPHIVPVIIKGRDLYTNGEAISLRLFKGAGFIDGAPARVENYNDLNPVASTVDAKVGIVVTTEGQQWGADDRIFGDGKTGQHLVTSSAGEERVLAPGTSYIVEIRNNGTSPAQVDYSLSWYEGWPDLPLG